ncbi:FeoA family protein [Ferriphaselus amnicola]|uniref:FeoA family protein n=1 Tax=Ferriphaselus amnicola TaxID=1188319 RepID=UPI000788D652|nr:FeoA family protein [Ferriphaselus amnicola]
MPKDSSAPASKVLSDLRPGDFATIIALHTSDEALYQRLLALGMRVGKSITIMRQAPFGGPLQVRIGSTDILIRTSEANKISVQKS